MDVLQPDIPMRVLCAQLSDPALCTYQNVLYKIGKSTEYVILIFDISLCVTGRLLRGYAAIACGACDTWSLSRWRSEARKRSFVDS